MKMNFAQDRVEQGGQKIFCDRSKNFQFPNSVVLSEPYCHHQDQSGTVATSHLKLSHGKGGKGAGCERLSPPVFSVMLFSSTQSTLTTAN